jgi:hypothetical protein
MPTSMGIVFFKSPQPIMLFKATYNYTKKLNGIGLYEIIEY